MIVVRCNFLCKICLKKATEHITKIEAKQILQIKKQNQRHGQVKNLRSEELKSSGITERPYNRQETIYRTQKKESMHIEPK